MKKLGCGCDLGCDCNKGILGQIQGSTGMNPWWFLAGAVGGVALWYVVKNAATPSFGPGKESIMPAPPKAPPSQYASLQAVAARYKQVEELYHRGDFTPEQALSESNGLIKSAKAFSVMDAAGVSDLITEITAFQDKVKDIIQWRKDNPQYGQPTPVTNIGPGFQAYG